MARTTSTSTSSRRAKPSSSKRQATSTRAKLPPKAAATAAPSDVKIALTHDQIAQRAYAIWVAKGRPLGLDAQNWAEAEADLRAAAAAE